MPEYESWAALVKQLLGSLGLNYIRLVQGVGMLIFFLNLVKLHDQYYSEMGFNNRQGKNQTKWSALYEISENK